MNAGLAFGHPPLEGEGRTAAGSPGWGDGGAADDTDAMRMRCHPLPAR